MARLSYIRYGRLLLFLAASPLCAAVAYISNCCQYPSTVSVVDTHSGKQTALWSVGTYPVDAVFSPNGKTAYISDKISQDVRVIEVATGTAKAIIPVGYAVEFMAITPNGHKLFVQSLDSASTSHIAVIDTATNMVAHTITFNGAGPLAMSPDGKTLYVLGQMHKQGGLLAIDTVTLKLKSAVPVYIPVGLAVSPDGSHVYVPNFGSFNYSPNVAVIDTSTNQVTATIPLPDTSLDPSWVQVSPDGSQVWVSEFALKRSATPSITVIQTGTNQIIGQITLPRKAIPDAIVFSPSGRHAYVTAGNSGVDVIDVPSMKAVSEITSLGIVIGPALSPDGATLLLPNTGSSRAAVIDQSNGATLASVPLGDMDLGNQLYLEYGGAAVSPDGAQVYLTNYYSNDVTVIDTATKRVVTSIPVGDEPVAVVFSPDGKRAYVANSYANSVTIVNTRTYATRTVRMPHSTYPSALAITPDGSKLYVAGGNPQPDFGGCRCDVFALDTASATVTASIALPYPVALGVSPDGASLYVVGGDSTSLVTISTATDTILRSVPLALGGPQDPVTGSVVVTPDGSRVFATDGQDGSVFEVDPVANTLLKTIPTGTNAGALALTPDGTQIWVGDYYAPAVSIIDVASAAVTGTVSVGNPSYGIAFAPQ